jgi:amylosucrase
LSDFYNGGFPGSFARGATFQFNPRTNDRRISGSCASLAGLEIALEKGDSYEIDLALRRILLLHSMILAFGGIPLLYMGDEIGLLNDDSYLQDPHLAGDNRWLHRPRMAWELAAKREDLGSVNGRLFQSLVSLIQARKRTPALHAEAHAHAVWTHNDAVFGLLRESPRGRILVLGNFSEQPQTVPAYRLQEMYFGGQLVDCISQRPVEGWYDVQLKPYESLWLQER